jgi:hypothetical protein
MRQGPDVEPVFDVVDGVVAAERRQIADLVDDLDDAQLATGP